MRRYSKSRSTGVALLSAILIVLVATSVVVSITHEEVFSIRKTARMQTMERAVFYAFGLEDFARLILLDDAKNSSIDHLQEDWALGIPPTPQDGVFIGGYLEDEQSRINLNNLMVSEEWVNRLRRLCNNLELDPSFIPALMDWIDTDFDIRYPDGAEDQYENYRVANRPMVDVSELMLVKNVTPEIYQKLQPYVTALPNPTDLNVNTMSDQVYLSLGEGLNAESFMQERDKQEFSDVADFIQRLQIPINDSGLGTSSAYFYAHGQVIQEQQVFQLNTLFHRDAQGISRVLYRKMGGL